MSDTTNEGKKRFIIMISGWGLTALIVTILVTVIEPEQHDDLWRHVLPFVVLAIGLLVSVIPIGNWMDN